ncbi:hypothetical protein [Glycomyces harbinensis]|uniref:DUF1579 domain-containing protein n=1 Tax=Glycomyces harbinensis TaxID=58114 RepID=A0A1G6RI12_9ACTN|nr:hypothetical protein [Glycomyces harbinensis]SDD04289.1 hypothetical protein SAMN05216270_101504 [Glycomyces harbinensis]
MRNPKLELLEGLVGSWKLTLSDAWFLEPAGTEVPGTATVEWLGDAFLVMKCDLDGELTMVFGRSDANDAYTALYQDDRGVCRVFAMTFDGANWTLLREDPDFHQRFIGEIGPDRIVGRWEASEDQGKTWRKDFDLAYDRVEDGANAE